MYERASLDPTWLGGSAGRLFPETLSAALSADLSRLSIALRLADHMGSGNNEILPNASPQVADKRPYRIAFWRTRRSSSYSRGDRFLDRRRCRP